MWLNKEAFVVKGAINSCLYNSRTGDIFHIDNSSLEKILKATFVNDTIMEELLINGVMVIDENNWDGDPKRIDVPEISYDFAWIEITQKCNLKCIHCYNGENDYMFDMSLNSFKKAVDQLLLLGIKKVQLIGGEPFLNKSIEQMIRYVANKMEFVEIFTNGTLLDMQLLKLIKENNVCLALSVYSYNEKMHNRVTKNDESYGKTIHAIKMMKEMGIRYRVCRVIIKNILLGQKNTDYFTLSENRDYVRMAGRADINLYDEEMLLKKLITKKNFSKKYKYSKFIHNVTMSQCFSSKLYIDAKLNVFPCVMERRIKYGNLADNDLKKLIENNVKIKYLNKDCIDECKECEFRYFCFDCRPDALNKHILSKPWYCTYQPLQGIWENEQDFIKSFKRRELYV